MNINEIKIKTTDVIYVYLIIVSCNKINKKCLINDMKSQSNKM